MSREIFVHMVPVDGEFLDTFLFERNYQSDDGGHSCRCRSEADFLRQKKQDIIESLINKANATNVTSIEESEPSTSSKNDKEKALKKKLKKKRQKEKKNSAKQMINETTDKRNGAPDENNVNHCQPANPTTITTTSSTASTTTTMATTSATDVKENEYEPPTVNNNNNSDTENTDDNDTEKDDVDFSIDAPVVPAFVQSTIHGRNNTMKMTKKTNDYNKSKDTSLVFDPNISDDSTGFESVKKGTKQAPVKFNKTPEGFGNQALHMIRHGNILLAISYLSRAISLDPIDTRHHINRSYCYLRVGSYANALKDIRIASKNFTDVNELAKAKCREGQAFCGLQNYEAAELAFRDSLKLTPNCPYTKRELRRMQVCQLVSMGFKERDAILTLQKLPNTTDAIEALSATVSSNEDLDSTGSVTDDEIYQSDEDEEPSNESLLSKTLDYDPNLWSEPRVPESMASKMTRNCYQAPRSESAERELRVIKTINPIVKPNPGVNEMAVWVGNVTPSITDDMIKKRFGKFGKVTSLRRAPDGRYCFVNFQTADASKKALEEASISGGNIDVNGHLLFLKPATLKAAKN